MDDDINMEMEQIQELKDRQEMILNILLTNLNNMYPKRYRFNFFL
jgi:hypothetical protein